MTRPRFFPIMGLLKKVIGLVTIESRQIAVTLYPDSNTFRSFKTAWVDIMITNNGPREITVNLLNLVHARAALEVINCATGQKVYSDGVSVSWSTGGSKPVIRLKAKGRYNGRLSLASFSSILERGSYCVSMVPLTSNTVHIIIR